MATTSEVKALRKSKKYQDSLVPNLFLRKTKHSTEYWIEYRDRYNQLKREILCPAGTRLKDARRLACDHLIRVSDPLEQLESTQQVNDSRQPTLDMIYDEHKTLGITSAYTTQPNYARYEAFVRDELGAAAIDTIRASDVKLLLYKVKVGQDSFAAFLRQLFTYADDREYTLPIDALVKAIKQVRAARAKAQKKLREPTTRILTNEEYKAMWEYLCDKRIPKSPEFAIFGKMLLYFAPRVTFLTKLKQRQIRGPRIFYKIKSDNAFAVPGVFDLLMPPWMVKELEAILKCDTDEVFPYFAPKREWTIMTKALKIKRLEMADVRRGWVHKAFMMNLPIRLQNAMLGNTLSIDKLKEKTWCVMHNAMFE